MKQLLTLFFSSAYVLVVLKMTGVIQASWFALFVITISPVWFPAIVLGLLCVFWVLFFLAVRAGLVLNNRGKPPIGGWV